MKSLRRCASQSSIPNPHSQLLSSLFITKNSPNPHLGFRRNLVLIPPAYPTNGHHQRQTKSLSGTKTTNSHITKPLLFHSDTSAANLLADARGKSGSVFDALQVLGEIPNPNVISWNLMIQSYNQISRFEESLRTFGDMRSLGFKPNQFTYGNVLSACAASQNLEYGEQMHSLVLKNGFFSNGYVCTGLIDLFSKSNSFDAALRVFAENTSSNVVCWNAIIAGAVRNEDSLIALDLFGQMVDGFCMPNCFTFSSILSACAAAAELEVGRGIHAWVIKCDSGDDVFVGTAIVDLYAKCSDMDAAVKEFSRMPVRNVVSWTAVISGFVQKDEAIDGLIFFKEMIQAGVAINKFTLTSVLLACAKSLMAKETIQIHCLTIKNGLYMDSVVKDSLVSTYAKIGYIELSEKVFEETGILKSPGTWSAMISGLAQDQDFSRSIELFQRMLCEDLKPDKKCSSAVLSIVDCIDFGRQLHSYVIKSGLVLDVLVGSALFTMYSKCGSIKDSYEFFKQMQEKDRVSWSSMISGFAGHGHTDKAFQLFRDMLLEDIKPDEMTLASVLTAFNGHCDLMKGKEIHGHAIRVGLGAGTLISNALVSMYSKCQTLVAARRVFDGFSRKDEVTWSSLVSGYAANGYHDEALSQFRYMLLAGFEIDHFICSSVLGVCANISGLGLGRQLHAHAIKSGIIYHLSVSSALVTMYSKCGNIYDSRTAFDDIENPDLVTWTAIIDGYALHGSGLESLKIFELMKKQGIKPDAVTLVSVLSACSHNGLLEEGFCYFNSMSTDYGIEPGVHHYACMVDLLGRAGRLKEAVNFIHRMPIEPNSLVWSTLLGACRVHGDVELGRLAAEKVLELVPRDSGTHISLSNISADRGEWEEVLRIRCSMKGGGIKKEPGWSII
ncbi:pentatricopeptide repeat-containing protein At1g74600, chloroplastic [Phoenix dactylifera]|uniref:Pentatricopeptide repeat-containing protein At1g74600, chloroplastic n=1 Tax=Phoenix dactylifera TaxID=42345 RepID=A0A8B7CMW5_PHODC|nr:pentatricopeptide repeat-containing protein At1g74600, chloroplastic [Phoenix dactylifera]